MRSICIGKERTKKKERKRKNEHWNYWKHWELLKMIFFWRRTKEKNGKDTDRRVRHINQRQINCKMIKKKKRMWKKRKRRKMTNIHYFYQMKVLTRAIKLNDFDVSIYRSFPLTEQLFDYNFSEPFMSTCPKPVSFFLIWTF